MELTMFFATTDCTLNFWLVRKTNMPCKKVIGEIIRFFHIFQVS